MIAKVFITNPDWQIFLASSSPRRQTMLSSLGIDFLTRVSHTTEPPPLPYESPQAYALRMAHYKCGELPHIPNKKSVLIATDTIVYMQDKVFGKPQDTQDAVKILQVLNGNIHNVMSATVILAYGMDPVEIACISEVGFGMWPQSVLEAYAQTGEGMDKAGAYALQGMGAFLINYIKGSFTNIIGLPLAEVIQALLKNQIIMRA